MSAPATRKAREAAASRAVDQVQKLDEAAVLRGVLVFPPAPGPPTATRDAGECRPLRWANGRGGPVTPYQFAAARRLKEAGMLRRVERDHHLAGWQLTPKGAKAAQAVEPGTTRGCAVEREPEQPDLFGEAA